MGKSKNKIISNLTINDLRELGIIGKKKRKGKRKSKKQISLIDPKTGEIIGGPKSDSSHMVGSTQSIQPSNTNNINNAIQQANLKLLKMQTREQKIKDNI